MGTTWYGHTVDWTSCWAGLPAGHLRDVLSLLCTGINKREELLGKIPKGADFGPWYDASVNSGGVSTDSETWTYWIGGDCDFVYHPESLTTVWYKNSGEFGLGPIIGRNPSPSKFDYMPMGAVFDERDHWGFIKCEGMSGTLSYMEQRECNPPMARQIDAMRTGIKNLMVDSLTRGSVSGGHRAGATHYSAAFVFPCAGSGYSAGGSPAQHCRYMRRIFTGAETPNCTQKKGWCGDCGKTSSPYGPIYAQRSDWIFCDEDCFAKRTNLNKFGMTQSTQTRSYCYWTLPRLLSYVNHRAGYITKKLPLGYDGAWWWETDRSWREICEDDDARKPKSGSSYGLTALYKIYTSMQGWLDYKNHSPLDARIWLQMRDCLNQLYMVRWNLGFCPPGVGLTVTGEKMYLNTMSVNIIGHLCQDLSETRYDCDLNEYTDFGTSYGGGWHYLWAHIAKDTSISLPWITQYWTDYTWNTSGFTTQVEPTNKGWCDDGEGSYGYDKPSSYSCSVNSTYCVGDVCASYAVVDVAMNGIGDHLPGLPDCTTLCYAGATQINCTWSEGPRFSDAGTIYPDGLLMGTEPPCPAGTAMEGEQNYLIYHSYANSCHGTRRMYHTGVYCSLSGWQDGTQGCTHGERITDVSWSWSGSPSVTMSDTACSGGSPSISQDLRWTPLERCPVEINDTACLCMAWSGIKTESSSMTSPGVFSSIPHSVSPSIKQDEMQAYGHFGDYIEWNIYSTSHPWCMTNADLYGYAQVTVPTNPDWFGESGWKVTDCSSLLTGWIGVDCTSDTTWTESTW